MAEEEKEPYEILWSALTVSKSGVITRCNVWVKRRRTNRRYIYVELTHVIMETGKSQDLKGESASWRHRRFNSFVSF